MEYDLQGNRTKLTDPDAGVITSKYDGWGQLVQEKQKIHLAADSIVTTYNYLPSGLPNYKLRNGETTNYGYDNLYRLKWISIKGKHSQGYTYDKYDRIIQTNDTVDGSRVYIQKTDFDLLGNVYRETYPSGYYTTNQYDKYGFLTSVKDGSNRLIWQALEENAKGQLTKYSQGGATTTVRFDTRGFQDSIACGSIINMRYNFNSKGNLDYRQDNLTGYKESFGYDAMNRLKNWYVYKNNVLQKSDSLTFNATTGNIATKTDIGNYAMNYGEAINKPHALTSISGVPAGFPTDSLTVTYTDFKKIKTLAEGAKTYALTYGVDEQRLKSVYKLNNATQETRYYLGNYEEIINSVGDTKKIHYLRGGAMLIMTGNAENLYYGYYDHLGSLIALVNEQGQVVERYAFDPWGNRRNPANWTQPDSRTSWIVNRGFTMHEHLDAFGIINMNGRVYDPLTAQFFSPDPYLQAPNNWLNYNRYSYALNNPLKYTDPSGEAFGIDDAIIMAAFIYLSGMQANFSYAAEHGTNPFNPGNWNWSSAHTYISMAGGAMMGAGVLGYSIPYTQVPGMITNGLLQGGIQVSLNGIGNLTEGRNFFNNWYWSAGMGFLSGAISGYELAKAKGSNYWWGGEVKYGRTQWSFNPSEKPYASYDFGLINGDNPNVRSDCGPATGVEADRYHGGKKNWNEIAEEMGYKTGEGTPVLNVKQTLQNNYGGDWVSDPNVIMNPDYMQDVSQKHDLISVLGDKMDPDNPNMMHWDNIRRIDYYSNKVVVRLRIGSYNLNDAMGRYKLNFFRTVGW